MCPPKILTSAVRADAGAIALYEGMGFTRTGRIIDDLKIEFVKPL